MSKKCTSELVALAIREDKITIEQGIQLSRIEPKYQDYVLSAIVGKTLEKTQQIVDEYLSRRELMKKRKSKAVKVRESGEVSEIRIDSNALEYQIIAENLAKIIPQVNYCIGKCLTTQDWTIDNKTKHDLNVKLNFLQIYIEKLLTHINA
jgi:hypothetical protein